LAGVDYKPAGGSNESKKGSAKQEKAKSKPNPAQEEKGDAGRTVKKQTR